MSIFKSNVRIGMDTIYWYLNATQGGANLHLGVNLQLKFAPGRRMSI